MRIGRGIRPPLSLTWPNRNRVSRRSVEQEVGGSSPPNCTTRQICQIDPPRQPAGAVPRVPTPACQSFAVHPQFGEFIAAGGLMIRSFHFGWMLAAAFATSMSPALGQGYTPEQEQ